MTARQPAKSCGDVLPDRRVYLAQKRRFDVGGITTDRLAQNETELRDLVMKNDGPDEVYALLDSGSFRRTSQNIFLIYKESIRLRCEDYNGRTRERDLDSAEFRQLRDWLEREHIDDLPTFDEGSIGDLRQVEFLHLSRARGRRVFMINPPDFRDRAFRSDFSGNRSDTDATIYGELTHRMTKLDNAPTRVFYRSLSDLPGFQLVHRREHEEVSSLRIKNDQIFAVTHPSPSEDRWYLLTEYGMAHEPVPAPPRDDATDARPIADGFLENGSGVQATSGPLTGKKIWAGTRNQDGAEGLWSADERGRIELLARGHYASPLLTPDGKWLVVDKFDRGGSNPWITVRIEAASRREEAVEVPALHLFRVSPITWIDSLHRVLLCRVNSDPDVPWNLRKPEFLLLDPATGKFEETPLEFRPTMEQPLRRLQPTRRANEYWAAIAEPTASAVTTMIGRYDTRHFRFNPVVQLKGINVQSHEFAVDEQHGFIWMTTDGDLLRIALPNSADKTDDKASSASSKMKSTPCW